MSPFRGTTGCVALPELFSIVKGAGVIEMWGVVVALGARSLAVAALVVLGVTACAPGDGPSSATSPTTSDRTTSAQPLTPTPGHPRTSIPAATDAPTTARGDVTKELGEYGELVHAATGTPYFGITVRSIAVVDSCPGEFAQPPNEGQFVVADVRAWLADLGPILDAEPIDLLMFTGPDQFRIVDEAGVEYSGLGSDAAWTCYEPSDRLIYTIAPGETNEGLIVLDSPVSHGSLIYAPDGYVGWEWRF